MNTHINKLIESKNTNFLFFWGHQPAKDGTITKSCFSQWWLSDFTENSVTYQTAEHYMMAGKARLFGDLEIEKQIIATKSPKDVKALGRKIKGFDNDLWNQHKYEIVKQGNLLKFSQNNNLKDFLISTDTKVIVEASPVDPVWGIGLSEKDLEAQSPELWKGENLLGFALMEVRDVVKSNK
jgi:ribA/ribD-fused uncharacterized protein